MAAIVLAATLALPCSGAPRAWAESSFDVAVHVDVAKSDPEPPDPPAKLTVRALVLDESGNPLSGVMVDVTGGSSAQATGADGLVLVSGLQKGSSYEVVASKEGYLAAKGTFVCRGVANEVWLLVLKAEGGSTPDPTPQPQPQPQPQPSPSPAPGPDTVVSNTYTTVRTEAPPAASRAEESDSEIEEMSPSDASKTPTAPRDERKSDSDRSSAVGGPVTADEETGFPWWLLLLAALVLAAAAALSFFLFRPRAAAREREEELLKQDAAGLAREDAPTGHAPAAPLPSTSSSSDTPGDRIAEEASETAEAAPDGIMPQPRRHGHRKAHRHARSRR